MGRTKKLRGYRTHGRGKKAGRGKGKRGGRGQAGLQKHRYTWVVKYDPDHFGRRGFKRHKYLSKPASTINLDELQVAIDSLEEAGFAKSSEGGYEIDLTRAGIVKLLGRGNVKMPLRVIVPSATPKAVEKLERAGGGLVELTEEG